ncbi:MAG TPA: transporter substrate-binding domain-containing protein [Pseudobacteroides sp.]|nr:transporter substrate-binding domain-containing protein [Pseudobacteroides sp.]
MKNVFKVSMILVLCIVMVLGVAGCTSNTASTGGNAAAKNTLQTVLDRGYLIVGTGSNNVPWHFKDDKGEYQGFDIEIAKILAKALFDDETKVQFVEQTSDSRIPNTLSGKVDCTIQFMTISAERAQQVAFSIPYYTEGSALLLSAKSPYQDYNDLVEAAKNGKKIKISVLQNAFAEDIVATYLPDAIAEQYEEQAMVIQAVNSGVVDAGIIDRSNLEWEIKQHPELYRDAGHYTYPQNYGIAMRPDDQIWINFVNTVLQDAMTGASYELYINAYSKWFGMNDQLSPPTVGMPKIYRNNNN